jgi:hypothetical protein
VNVCQQLARIILQILQVLNLVSPPYTHQTKINILHLQQKSPETGTLAFLIITIILWSQQPMGTAIALEQSSASIGEDMINTSGCDSHHYWFTL